MKFSTLKFSIASITLLALGSTHAQSSQSGNIGFTGNISPTTCVVHADDRNQSILYGIVPPTTGFTGNGGAVGNVALPAYEQPMVIRIINCTTPGNGHPTTASAQFRGPITSAGRVNTSNSSVEIEVLHNNAPFNLNNPTPPITLTTATNTLNFRTRYYVSSVPVNPGEANANLTFSMSYQ